MSEITLLLERIHAGDTDAANRLLPLIYSELRAIAAAQLRHERSAHTLQPTALIHEAWLRLGGDAQPAWHNRRHFLGAAAEAMRRILIDLARQRQAKRHGGALIRTAPSSLDELPAPENDAQLLALDEALARLATLDPTKAELVKLRYFGGLEIAEAAATLDISPATAKRWWTFARSWLFAELTSDGTASRTPDAAS